MEKVKVGVVGLGWIAQVTHIPLLQKLQDAELVAVCDRERSKARLVAEKFGVKRVYTDVGQRLSTEELDAVILSTSTDAHRDVAVASMRAGKDVLVEKPIARTYAEAAEISEVARETKRKLMVGMNHRFRPDTMILKGFIEASELGRVFYTRAGWLKQRSTDSTWVRERVEGFTSLLWTVISALAFKLSSSPEILLLVINIILVSLGIVYALNYLQTSRKNGETWQARLFWSVLFLVFLFTSPRYVVWNTITLMENALWSTLLLVTTVFVIQDLPSPRAINLVFLPLSILLLLARPESLLWVLVFLCVLFLRLVFDGGIARAVKVLAPSLAGLLLAMTLLTLFRLQYFGYPLPNTYYAKVSPSLTYNVGQGALYLLRYFISDPIATVMSLIAACQGRSLPEGGNWVGDKIVLKSKLIYQKLKVRSVAGMGKPG